MSALAIGAIVFAVIVGGMLLGMVLRQQLPEPHLSDESKDVVRAAMGLVATISALVLGLLIASAKTSYDAQNTRVRQITASLILIDNLLAQYGPEAQTARALLRDSIPPMIDRIWHEPGTPAKPVAFVASEPGETFIVQLFRLSPRTDLERVLHARVVQAGTDLVQIRLMMFAEQGNAIPMPFLAVLVFWLTIIFASFSLFTRPNPTVIAALVVCALSGSAAIFLILELGQPFDGLMRISSEPLRQAVPPLTP